MKSSSEWVIYACGISELRPFGSVHWPKRKSLPLGRASCYTTPIDRSERVFMGGDDSKAAGAVRTEFIADDVTLVADVAGDPDAPTVVLMHGGGQTRHSWSGAMRALLDEGYRVINYDARGHGESSWSADGVYTFARRAADLRTVLAEIAAPVALVGASMGGLTAMQAIGEGALPSAVVLVDIVLRPEPRGVQRIRNFMRANPGGFATIEEAVDAVAAYNPARPRSKDSSGLARNLRSGTDGRLYWHWDPRMMSEKFDTDVASVDLLVAAIKTRPSVPTLLVRGLHSDVVSDAGVADLRSLIPSLEVFDVAAGHMVSGDSNDVFNRATIEFLGRNFAPTRAGARSTAGAGLPG